jgi:hypothetical protein
MFSSRLNVFRPAHLPASRPSQCHPTCPEPRRQPRDRRIRPCRMGRAFFRPWTAPNSYASRTPLRFPTATLLRTRRNTRNSTPLMCLLHNSRIPRVGGAVPATCPSSALSLARLTSVLERPLINIIPFRISTYEKRACNPFRIRTCKTQNLKWLC